jgi:6-phosphogluconate dehydrogenase (decarboxylating)
LYTRQASQGGDDAALRAVAALRNQFGGHRVTAA